MITAEFTAMLTMGHMRRRDGKNTEARVAGEASTRGLFGRISRIRRERMIMPAGARAVLFTRFPFPLAYVP